MTASPLAATQSSQINGVVAYDHEGKAWPAQPVRPRDLPVTEKGR